MISFKHSGDIGDIIYSLPAVSALAAGEGSEFYLSQWPGRTRVTMNRDSVEFIRPLLKAQGYIQKVEEWRGQSVCYNLDEFRRFWSRHPEFGVTIAEWHTRTFGVPAKVIDQPWLESPQNKVAPVVIHRSERYHHPEFPWKRVIAKYRKQCVFVGLEKEHDAFCDKYGRIPFYPVRDALDMATVINGSDLFIGNQSFPNAVAEGLKKPKITEIFAVDPNCCFERADAQYVFTRNIWLPDL